MDERSPAVVPATASPIHARRRLIATVIGAIGGIGAVGSLWLPLATVAGLGPVGCFDYSRPLVYPCVAVASLAAVFSLTRCFRLALLAAGILCGLLSAIGIELFQALRDALNVSGGDTAQMARQMVAHSSLQAGAFVLPLCGVLCVAAGLLGSSPREAPAITSGS